MEQRPGDAFSQHSGDASDAPPSGGMGRPRRMSMEEDMFYREVMTSRPKNPPSYETAMQAAVAAERRAMAMAAVEDQEERLPQYSSELDIEGVFMRKMEMEDTIKRAEYRDWRMVYVELRGTALNVYSVKKERGWWSSKPDAPNIAPDNPPWVKKHALERSYSLLYADAGIAADYKKKRYVIRLRVETDQFLLSCFELSTFVTWLDRFYAAFNVAAPIDERDFPRDYSIPRIQRIRFLRGQRPPPQDHLGRQPDHRRPDESDEDDSEGEGEGGEPPDHRGGGGRGPRPAEYPIMARLSISSYANENVDPETGKWLPEHGWTIAHDQLYARLCYAVLLFKSPRKSNYIVSRGKRWWVDWDSGKMVRVLPPAYGEIDVMGPWQVIMAENRRI
ncbi:uncharacterized protein QC763_707120 [Podospora pseudopauciseta]|uniref:Pleckstrin homology domain-containing protein n=2 Tax=Podospora TaxID=5144 RepID=A0ABR0H126_9PEZI|nr:hypothetical protein QC763_707120 [Podospora pseudopauciseta]KAK4668414.1 hypothetical protein QC764_707120 [Podospora pseudoanserina]